MDGFNLTEMKFYPTLQLFGIVPKWMQNDMDRLEQSVILLFTGPEQAAETIGQNIFNTADEEGVAFSVGYVIVDIAAEIFVSKGLKKLKAAKIADDVPVITLEALQNAELEYIIAYAEAEEEFVKYADNVADAAEGLAKYADEITDAAGDLAKYVDEVWTNYRTIYRP